MNALKFVRQRHGVPGGDLGRVRRQQAFLAGLANRLFSTGTLADPGRLANLVDALTRSVVLDRNWDLLTFARQVAGLAGDRIEFSTIPTIRPDLPTPYDGSAVEVDPARVRAYVHGLLTGPARTTGETAGEADTAGTGTPSTVARADSGGTAPMGHADEPITAGGVPCVN